MSADVTAAPATTRALAGARTAYGEDWAPSVRAIAPGRIELLGNHLDYNGGPVLAAAINRVVTVLARDLEGADSRIRVVATDVGMGPEELQVTTLAGWRHGAPPASPFDYARGLVAAVQERPGLGLRIPSEITFAGDVPIGFGLSSSAALCVALASALVRRPLEVKQWVLLAQEAEHRAGMPCGTMDQAASVAGGVIRYDAATLAVEHLRPDLGNLTFIVADSGVDRSLGASAYPTRVSEAGQILEMAKGTFREDIPHLAAIDRDQMDRLIAHGLTPVLSRRLLHIVSEAQRVELGVAALRQSDWPTFGDLMTASGLSSATDYDVSHPQVEELVGHILAVEGVLGARMMGGGGGGTALALLPSDRVGALEAALRQSYYARYGMNDRQDLVQRCAFAPGARVETESLTAADVER